MENETKNILIDLDSLLADVESKISELEGLPYTMIVKRQIQESLWAEVSKSRIMMTELITQ